MQNDMHKNIGTILFLMVLTVLLSIHLSAQENDKEDEQLIRLARKLSNEAIVKKDSDALALYWTEDYHLISSGNLELSGKDKNRHLFAQDFNSANSKVFVRSTTHIDIYPDWNMAAENGEWTGHWKEPDGEVNIKGSYYAKWHKVNGQWKIRAEIFVPLTCTGSKYCKTKPF
jgi:ketosteroid isomerase-like protein